MSLTFRIRKLTVDPVAILRDWWRVIIPINLAMATALTLTISGTVESYWRDVIYIGLVIPLAIIFAMIPPLQKAARERHWRDKARFHASIVEAANCYLDKGLAWGWSERMGWRYKRVRYSISGRWFAARHARLARRMGLDAASPAS